MLHGTEWRDNDGVAPGDNLYLPPDPGFSSSNYRPARSYRSSGSTFPFLYVMSLLLGAPLLSLVPFIWPITVAIFWLGVAAFLFCGLLTNARVADRSATWLAFTFSGCAAVLPLVSIASVMRAIGGH